MHAVNLLQKGVLVGLWMGICSLAMGTTYYVSPSGNDDRPGTSRDLAWKTLARVQSQMIEPGDEILLEGGATFRGNLVFAPPRIGTRSNPIIIGSYGKGKAKIEAGKLSGIEVLNGAGFEIRDLIIVGDGRSDNDRHGILFYRESVSQTYLAHIRIEGVEASGFNRGGITVYAKEDEAEAAFEDIRITGCVSHDNGDHGIELRGKVRSGTKYAFRQAYIGHCESYRNYGQLGKTQAHTGSGIVIGNTDGAIIERSIAYQNGRDNRFQGGGPVGIWLWDTREGVIQSCESHHNQTGSGKDGGGFDLDGGCRDCVIQYCYSHDNDGAGYLIAEYDGARPLRNAALRFNISENDGRANGYGGIHLWKGRGTLSDVAIYHNTVYMSPANQGTPTAFKLLKSGMQNIRVVNNVFWVKGNLPTVDIGPENAGVWFLSNDYFTQNGDLQIIHGASVYAQLSQWRKQKAQEIHRNKPYGMVVNPRFNSVGNGGTVGNPDKLHELDAYQLSIESPLKGAAFPVAKRFEWELGPYDFFLKTHPFQGGDIGASLAPRPHHQQPSDVSVSWNQESLEIKAKFPHSLSSAPVNVEFRASEEETFLPLGELPTSVGGVDREGVFPSGAPLSGEVRLSWTDEMGVAHTTVRSVDGPAFDMRVAYLAGQKRIRIWGMIGQQSAKWTLWNLQQQELLAGSFDRFGAEYQEIAIRQPLASGLYIVRVESGGQIMTELVQIP
ncbi:right-handed parallel beta-helix repeat-containing protein [Pontibacter sp. G13]|uniref:right-handed parallel beta-helix repeat-containing protein n=1 Tax=Pontibacter sp. G13 TaxID=3074898 RepID=UPI00288A7C37|nr:right-handed parallel beta-helix repeat-containing protein [Pontibacter sp. G13]WNJ20107.1 right-handed parallel beta-helix repeat-containing protein [Pontibacter sp. G13]